MKEKKLTQYTGSIYKEEIHFDEGGLHSRPQIAVPFDLWVEKNDQKSVDAGHSPWRLDPAYVAQVFVNVLISPEGIIGDYKIPYEAIKITMYNGIEAIAEIDSEDTIAAKVYLKRLVRQDDTGIWTVVGYDPVAR